MAPCVGRRPARRVRNRVVLRRRTGDHGRHGGSSGVRSPLQGGLPPVDGGGRRRRGDRLRRVRVLGYQSAPFGHPGDHARECRPVRRRGGRADHRAAVRVPVLAARAQVRAVPSRPGRGRGAGVVPGGAERPGARPPDRQGVLPRHPDRRPAAGRAVVRGRHPPGPGPPSGRSRLVPGQALGRRRLGRLPRGVRRPGPDQAAASGSPDRASGSSRPGTRWYDTGSARRPRPSSTGSARPTCGLWWPGSTTTTGRSRHRWNRCCRRWRRRSCPGAAASGRCW